MPYVKLDTGILDSSLWLEDAEVRIVFITILSMCRPDGLCEATAPGIARRANLSLGAVRKALARLEAPDPDSRSLNENGRRIERIDGGYRVVNYLKYREKEHTAAGRMRRYRERKRYVTLRHVTQAEAQAQAEALETTEKRGAVAPRPSAEEVHAYILEKGYSGFTAQQWVDHYTANGWKVGRNPMRDWKAAVRTWAARQRAEQKTKSHDQLSGNTSNPDRPCGLCGGPWPCVKCYPELEG